MILSRRVLILLTAAVITAFVVGSAYAFSAGTADQQSTRSTPSMQEEPDADGAQDDDGPGAPDKAALIADAFDASPDAVRAFHGQGIGWGALFKLYAFARARGVSVDELVAAAPPDANGEKDFAFGEMKKTLTPEQLALMDEGPKNLGQLVSGSHKKSHATTP